MSTETKLAIFSVILGTLIVLIASTQENLFRYGGVIVSKEVAFASWHNIGYCADTKTDARFYVDITDQEYADWKVAHIAPVRANSLCTTAWREAVYNTTDGTLQKGDYILDGNGKYLVPKFTTFNDATGTRSIVTGWEAPTSTQPLITDATVSDTVITNQ